MAKIIKFENKNKNTLPDFSEISWTKLFDDIFGEFIKEKPKKSNYKKKERF